MIIEATLTERREREHFFLLCVCGEHHRSKLISNPQSSNEKRIRVGGGGDGERDRVREKVCQGWSYR